MNRFHDAVAWADAHEISWPRTLRAHLESGYFEPAPDNALLGPLPDRGGPAGVILVDGAEVAHWGDPDRPDPTFSVAKSYLSLLAGIAVADGLIADIDEPVGRTVRDGHFDGPRNGAVTWRHLLTNTSEWEGTLFGKSDVIDRNRDIRTEGRGAKGAARPLQAPGTHWEYNDVRVNALSLALLHRFRRPLGEVFRERIMDPIGASSTWRWVPYDDAWVEVEGTRLLSVPGGCHWGGGVWISARDQALIGELVRRDGMWNGREVIPAAWLAASFAPCPLRPDYGLLWWLNAGGVRAPAAPHSSVFASGAGGNVTWIDKADRLVAVSRWLDPAAYAEFAARVMRALAPAQAAS